MNKLYLFGCSHSTPTRPVKDEEFWGDILAKKLNLKLYKDGLPGLNVDSILYDLQYHLLLDPPVNGDVVIWNTSYMLRIYSDRLLAIHKDNVFSSENEEINLIEQKVWKNDMVQIFHWFLHTKTGFDLLNYNNIETFQWLLDGENDFFDLMGSIIDEEIFTFNNKELPTDDINNYYSRVDRQIPWIVRQDNFNKLTKWENLLRVSNDFKCWDEFIKTNVISAKNSHLNTDGNKKMANLMYEQIKEYRNEK